MSSFFYSKVLGIEEKKHVIFINAKRLGTYRLTCIKDFFIINDKYQS